MSAKWNDLETIRLLGQVDTLEAAFWYANENQDVLSLLANLKVKTISMYWKKLPNRMLTPLVDKPCLSLKTIMISRMSFNEGFIRHSVFDSLRCLWVNSKVKILVIMMSDDNASNGEQVYKQLVTSGIERSFSLLHVRFKFCNRYVKQKKGKFHDKVRRHLSLNMKSLENCRIATILFLARPIGGSRIAVDVRKTVASMIWSTRGTKGWSLDKPKK